MNTLLGYPPFLLTLSFLIIAAGIVVSLPFPVLRRYFTLPFAGLAALLLTLTLIRARFWPGLVPVSAASLLLGVWGTTMLAGGRTRVRRPGRPLVLFLVILALVPAWLAAPPGLPPGPILELSRARLDTGPDSAVQIVTMRRASGGAAAPGWLPFVLPQDGRGSIPALGLTEPELRRETGLPTWLAAHLSTASGRIVDPTAAPPRTPSGSTEPRGPTLILVLPAGHVWQSYRSLAARIADAGIVVILLSDAGGEFGNVDGLRLPDGSGLPARLVAEIGRNGSEAARESAGFVLRGEEPGDEAGDQASSPVSVRSALTAMEAGIGAAAPQLRGLAGGPVSVAGIGEGSIAAVLLALALEAERLVLLDPAPALALDAEVRDSAFARVRLSLVYPAGHAIGEGLLGPVPNPGLAAVVLGTTPGQLASGDPLLLPPPLERTFGRDTRVAGIRERSRMHDLILAALEIPGARLDRWVGSSVLLQVPD